MKKRIVNIIITFIVLLGNIVFYIPTKFNESGADAAYAVNVVFGIFMSLVLLSAAVGLVYLTIKEWNND